MTYCAALQIMVFCAAEPKKDLLLIRRNAEWLAASQVTDGDRAGAWTYFAATGRRDAAATTRTRSSPCSGLHEAEQVGIKVDPAVWQRSLRYWLSCQGEDGSWGYYKAAKDEPRDAGHRQHDLRRHLRLGDRRGQAGGRRRRRCPATRSTAATRSRTSRSWNLALQWLGNHFSVHTNPTAAGGLGSSLAPPACCITCTAWNASAA